MMNLRQSISLLVAIGAMAHTTAGALPTIPGIAGALIIPGTLDGTILGTRGIALGTTAGMVPGSGAGPIGDIDPIIGVGTAGAGTIGAGTPVVGIMEAGIAITTMLIGDVVLLDLIVVTRAEASALAQDSPLTAMDALMWARALVETATASQHAAPMAESTLVRAELSAHVVAATWALAAPAA